MKAALRGPLPLVVGATVATWSVVQYRLSIVVVYTVLTALLIWSLARSSAGDRSPLSGRRAAALTLAAAGLGTLGVRAYTYLEPGPAWTVRYLLAGAALLGAVLLFAVRREIAPDLVLGVAVVAYLVASVLLIHFDPTPKIDVWITLQQGSTATWHGGNVYAQNWSGSPGIQDAFTYLPGMVVLLSPGKMLAGDVRWALVAVTLIAALCVRLMAARGASPRSRTAAAVAAALILLLPGTATQVEQAWTEPLLLACLAGWALAMTRRKYLVAIVVLALGVASKQHLVLLLPVLAAWPAFGWRRAIATGGLAGVFVLPWFLASPADMWHDTVSLLVSFPPLRFADTLYIAAMRELTWQPPFWITGAIVLGTVAAAAVAVHRRRPEVAQVLQWCALVLLVANLVNKQAFYNQYWLVMALVLASWGAAGITTSRGSVDPATDEAHGEDAGSRTGVGAPSVNAPAAPQADPAT
jgi:hypothetical protein